MNAETFIEYLKKPSKLYQVSYQQLKSLVLQYPYCQNLRFLLVKKSQLDSHKDLERNKQLAASYSIDRGYLFKLLREEKPEMEGHESYSISEEYLELKELTDDSGSEKNAREGEKDFLFDPEEDELVLDEISPVPRAMNPFADHQQDREGPDAPKGGYDTGTSNLDPEIEELFDIPEGDRTESPEDPGLFADTNFLSDAENSKGGSGFEPIVGQVPEFGELLEENVIPDIAAGLNAVDYLQVKMKEFKDSVKYPNPAPKSSFRSWLQQFQSPQPGEHFQYHDKGPDVLPENESTGDLPGEIDDDQKEKLRVHAQQSITEDEELITETLAILLEKQKQYGKAINMYKRLSLIFPEKSAFFAQKIEELEKLM